MSRGSSTDARRGLFGRLFPADGDRRAVAVLFAGGVLAVSIAALGGFLPVSGVLVTFLFLFAQLLPVAGIALVAVTLWWIVRADRARGSSIFEGEPPEAGITRAKRRVGKDVDQVLDRAAGGRYRCVGTDAADDVSRRLVEGAARTLTSRRGIEPDAALEAVRSGTWTDDPVVAAFLADERRQPSDEQFRSAIDPGAAYGRQVRRTLDAVEAIDARPRRRATEVARSHPHESGEEGTSDREAQRSTRRERPEVAR